MLLKSKILKSFLFVITFIFSGVLVSSTIPVDTVIAKGSSIQNPSFLYQNGALEKVWSTLHSIDGEPYPSPENLQQLFERTGADKADSPYAIPDFDGDYNKLAIQVQGVWRSYHHGDYQSAFEQTEGLGLAGLYPALRILGVQSKYTVENTEQRKEYLADYLWGKYELLKKHPVDYTNAYYGLVYAFSKYAVTLPIPKAIADGIPFKLRKIMDKVEKREPEHAAVKLLLGTYHCDVVGKIGGVMAKVTFKAKESTCIDYFHKAIQLEPDSISTRAEYASELILVNKKKAPDRY